MQNSGIVPGLQQSGETTGLLRKISPFKKRDIRRSNFA
jgi:hypothetical protein